MIVNPWHFGITPEAIAILEEPEEHPPNEPPEERSRSADEITAGLEAAAREANSYRRTRMSDTILDGRNEDPPGHRVLDGSDLEIAYNRSGDHLVLRVNKGPVQVFRVMLVDAFKTFDDKKLFNFNSVSPDFIFKIGGVHEGLMAIGRSVGLTLEQMQKLEAKAREIAK